MFVEIFSKNIAIKLISFKQSLLEKLYIISTVSISSEVIISLYFMHIKITHSHTIMFSNEHVHGSFIIFLKKLNRIKRKLRHSNKRPHIIKDDQYFK